MSFLLNYLIYFFARFLQWSYRFEYHGIEHIDNLDKNNKNYLLAIWHQNLLPGILAQSFSGKSYVVIVSKSKDAEPVAFTCQKLGHLVARGSSRTKTRDKGGQKAKEEMIEYLKKGHPGAVTVDGPKGPAFKVKRGIVDMAIESGAVLVPYTVSSKSFFQFQSWDKFRFPYPFTTIFVHYGEPVTLNGEEIIDNQEKLEQEMLRAYSEVNVKNIS